MGRMNVQVPVKNKVKTVRVKKNYPIKVKKSRKDARRILVHQTESD